MESPVSRGSTPRAPQNGVRAVLRQGSFSPYKEGETIWREGNTPKHPYGGVIEGHSPSYYILPFPSGEGDTGDGAITT